MQLIRDLVCGILQHRSHSVEQLTIRHSNCFVCNYCLSSHIIQHKFKCRMLYGTLVDMLRHLINCCIIIIIIIKK